MSLDNVAFFQSSAHVVRDVRSQCLASLVVMAWDGVLTFGDEVEYIWRVPWTSKVKWLYIYFRYLALAIHVAYDLALAHLTSGRASALTCRTSMVLVWITVQLCSTLFEYILALCAYALFNRSRRVGLLLGVLMGGEIISSGINLLNLLDELSFETVCVLVYLPKGNVVYATVVVMTQSTLMWLILSKSFSAAHTGRGRTPLVSLLIKSVITTYGLLIPFLTFSFLSIMKADNRAISLFLWSISILSTCSCRLIIDLEKLCIDRESSSDGIVLTTHVEV